MAPTPYSWQRFGTAWFLPDHIIYFQTNPDGTYTLVLYNQTIVDLDAASSIDWKAFLTKNGVS